MASTTVHGASMSVSNPSAIPSTSGSPAPFVDVMALGGSSDPQSEDGEDPPRRETSSVLEYDELDDQIPRMSPTKRRLDDPDMDFGQTAKKRRKQYKPVRIAVPAASTIGEEPNTLSTPYIPSTAGLVGPEDEGYEGEDDGETGIKYDDMREGLQARLSAETKVLASGSLQQGFPRSESTFAYKCFECAEAFASPEALSEHDELVHRSQTQQNTSFQLPSSTEENNPPKKETPLDLAQNQPVNSEQQIEFPYGQWQSGHSGPTSGNSLSDRLPKSRASPSQLQPMPFPMNPFGDGKILIPNILGLAPPFLLPHIPEKSPSTMVSQAQSTITTGNTENNSSAIRIFNPEAYCELCNKEFCNKYFLKTHKANKHGIYSDTSTMSGNSVPAVSFSNAQPMPTIVPPRTPIVNPSICTQKTQVDINNIPKPNTGVQMKINCEVCHKKFSNRYVVLRHKAKVHGLVEESLIGADLAGKIGVDYWPRFEREELGNTSTSSETGSIPFDNQPNENNITAQVDYVGDTRPFSREKTNLSPQVSMNKSSPSMSFKLSPSNSFTEFNMDTEETKQQFQQDFPVTPSASETSTIHSTVQTSNPSHTWPSYQASPSTSTAKISSLTHERLRKLGVINADAFCEICCKEYCNKYFLRTHKLKRHGIVTPEFETKGGPVTPGRGVWNQIQTSPLNLIVGEQGGVSWNPMEKNLATERTNNEENKKEGSISNGTNNAQTELPEGERLECNVCGRHFQSHYLMQMHRAYMHASPSSTERNTEEITFPEATTLKTQSSICNSNGSNTREDQSPNNMVGASLPSENSPPEETSATSQNDYVSGNLQKIQTMIMQLNKFNEGKLNCCSICNKEVEDKFILRSHMITEHGVMIEDEKEIRNDENSSDSPSQQSFPSAYCSICKKDFFAKCFLKKHITDFHGNNLPKNLKEEVRETPERPTNTSIEKQVSVTPTSSYCEICNKELCNKYFMKTHMQRMHGIEIENGSQIGGVICDICNKELCSKYFLRVHKQNTHGIVEDTGVLQQTKDNGNSSQGTPPASAMGPTIPDSNDQSLKPAEVGDLNHRYFTHFTEVCPICNRRFRSTKWLKAHLINDHSEIGVEKWKELELQYQIQLQHTRHVMAKAQSGTMFSSKSSQSLENGGAVTQIQPWKTNIGTQSELSISYSEASGSSGMRKLTNDMELLNHDALQPGTIKYVCEKRKTETKTVTNATEGGNSVDKPKATQSNIFGGGGSDSTVKHYHCSFCAFRTPVLAYLFVHEKSHTGLQSPPTHQQPDTKKQFQCPICHQNFIHTDIFQHHLLTHQYSGLLGSITSGSPVQNNYSHSSENFQNSLRTQRQNESNTDEEYENLREPIVEVVIDETGGILGDDECDTLKFKCTKCTKRFKSQDLLLIHAQKDICIRNVVETSPPAKEVTPEFSSMNSAVNNACPHFPTPSSTCLPNEQEKFKCMQCPFLADHIATLKKHIMKEHPEEDAEVGEVCRPKRTEVAKGAGCSSEGESGGDPKEWVGRGETQPAVDVTPGFDSGDMGAAIELRRRLYEAAAHSQVPASYAVPQKVRLREEGLGRSSFIMQPFLLEEPDDTRRSPGDGTSFQSHSINGTTPTLDLVRGSWQSCSTKLFMKMELIPRKSSITAREFKSMDKKATTTDKDSHPGQGYRSTDEHQLPRTSKSSVSTTLTLHHWPILP